jgi:hypothetical protein
MKKSSFTKIVFLAALVFLAFYFSNIFDSKTETAKVKRELLKKNPEVIIRYSSMSKIKADNGVMAEKSEIVSANPIRNEKMNKTKPKGAVLKFRLEDGLAVAQGDLIVGALVNQDIDPENVNSSFVVLPYFKLWPSSVIPFYIEPDLVNSERVLQALALFDGTAIQFVPYTDQNAALVFTVGSENCKSYVGYIGKLQPILLSPDCKPDDIAHEILHALGFIHEQNRSDRDNFISVLADNIQEGHIENFEILPNEFMTVSGLTPFDFESLMIYPDWMFAKSGSPTMRSKSGQRIEPSKGLSQLDRDRLNQAYGDR